MTDKEAMAMALEALEYIDDGANNQGAHIGISWRCVSTKANPAIAALKERLENPMREVQRLGQEIEQEPVAHWSDCAVHSEPAYPKSECDCGGIVAVADYTALSDKYVALSDKYVALKAQHKEQEPVAWLLTDKNINSLQVDSIQRLINRLNHAHHTDLCVRINGQDEWFQADWLKHMVRATPSQRKPLTDEQISAASKGHMTRNGFARAIEAAHGIKENQ
jgi:hypothetical protein